DEDLKKHIYLETKRSGQKFKSNTKVYFGRRIGWYAIVRAIKPKIIVETGVDKGLGSCILTSALMKNKSEGYPGYYYGTDINPKAGFLLTKKYSKYGELLFGDSIESLKKLNKKIDLFINDSDHSAEYEYNEYLVIKSKLSKKGIILGDNCEATDKLIKFSLENKRCFLYFQENPNNFFKNGAGIGFSYVFKKG
ncbi:MAG: class I SAM-dependent methyltransferase, partial [Candidatus ainarchaeum sp.]|nr:class I SAM-dependent methyltransferase [Candidatus ainarchaeum sp.]